MILGIIYLIVAEKLAEWIKMGYGLYELQFFLFQTVKFIQSVPGNCFLRMETGIFYELEFYLRCFIGSFLRFKIWRLSNPNMPASKLRGKVRMAVLYAVLCH